MLQKIALNMNLQQNISYPFFFFVFKYKYYDQIAMDIYVKNPNKVFV